LNPVKYKLSNRIRINNNIKEFTYRLFDLNRNKYPLDMSNVKIHYASNVNELETYFTLYKDEYTYISIPNTNYNYGLIQQLDIIDVVGKDYENVLMVLDNNYFYYDKKLSSFNSTKNDNLYLKILYLNILQNDCSLKDLICI
jgi:trans-aconitate methyltransferase